MPNMSQCLACLNDSPGGWIIKTQGRGACLCAVLIVFPLNTTVKEIDTMTIKKGYLHLYIERSWKRGF